MFPVFYTLELTVGSARLLGVAAVVLLSLYIVWDGRRGEKPKAMSVLVAQAVAFLVAGLAVVIWFVTPERLPEEFFVPLRTWGLMVVIGMFVCFFIQRRLGRKVGLSGEDVLTIWVYGGIAAIVGARLVHVSVNYGDYADAPLTVFKFWDGGMAYIGSMLGALVFATVYLLRTKKPLFASLDVLCLGVALTHGFGRLGCFSAGCCYGKSTELFWGVSFPPGSIAHFAMAGSGLIHPAQSTPHLHPTQLLSSALTFALGLALYMWWRNTRPQPGLLVAAYLMSYPTVRFLVELLRGDPEREFLFRWPEAGTLPFVHHTDRGVGDRAARRARFFGRSKRAGFGSPRWRRPRQVRLPVSRDRRRLSSRIG